jgi:hypothetical protein
MVTARTVAAFTTDTVFEKRRICVAVLSAEYRLHPAGMTPQATRFYGAVEPHLRVVLVSGRDIPLLFLRIPSHG